MESLEQQTKVTAELYNATKVTWDEIWPAISKLEDECFPGKGLGEAYFKEKFLDEATVVVLLKSDKDIIGFTCGVPDKSERKRGQGQ